MELIENNTTVNQKVPSRSYSDAYLRAKQKVENLRGFYVHLIIYVVVNSFITWQQVNEYIVKGKTLAQAFQDEGTYMLWIVWGLGLVLHGFNVFVTNGVFGQKWEERKIKQYMNEEESRTWK
ncbi:2TM domain-containing protein [uncultured Kordia sp.]|uniref:2TM domain-containing protein n=1 Tax=uncultured Kordia sp. TaxID=507699 RepID=UPI0026198A1F|nr:2TM domain-containing protein [uncultured Kordia sp.]